MIFKFMTSVCFEYELIMQLQFLLKKFLIIYND
jgi:hypothetical protein